MKARSLGAPASLPASREVSRVITAAASPEPHRGWYSRGYLPHWDHPGMMQGITIRLHDALPAKVLARWEQELSSLPESEFKVQLNHRVAAYLDAGHGACWLRDERIASLVEATLLHFDGHRYRVLSWCVMPNHVHVLIETLLGHPLAKILHSWKSYSASEANKILRRTGTFWFREYHDRYIRNAEHFANAIRYIEENPVAAGLVKLAKDWPFGSARFR